MKNSIKLGNGWAPDQPIDNLTTIASSLLKSKIDEVFLKIKEASVTNRLNGLSLRKTR